MSAEDDDLDLEDVLSYILSVSHPGQRERRWGQWKEKSVRHLQEDTRRVRELRRPHLDLLSSRADLPAPLAELIKREATLIESLQDARAALSRRDGARASEVLARALAEYCGAPTPQQVEPPLDREALRAVCEHWMGKLDRDVQLIDHRLRAIADASVVHGAVLEVDEVTGQYKNCFVTRVFVGVEHGQGEVVGTRLEQDALEQCRQVMRATARAFCLPPTSLRITVALGDHGTDVPLKDISCGFPQALCLAACLLPGEHLLPSSADERPFVATGSVMTLEGDIMAHPAAVEYKLRTATLDHNVSPSSFWAGKVPALHRIDPGPTYFGRLDDALREMFGGVSPADLRYRRLLERTRPRSAPSSPATDDAGGPRRTMRERPLLMTRATDFVTGNAAQSEKTVLLVTGEGGNGKSVLLRELRRELERKGALVFQSVFDSGVNDRHATFAQLERSLVRDALSADPLLSYWQHAWPGEGLLSILRGLDALAEDRGSVVWLIDQCDHAPRARDELAEAIMLGRRLTEAGLRRVRLVVAVREAFLDPSYVRQDHVKMLKVGTFSADEAVDMIRDRCGDALRASPEALLALDPCVTLPLAWRFLDRHRPDKLAALLEKGQARTIVDIFDEYRNSLAAHEFETLVHDADKVIRACSRSALSPGEHNEPGSLGSAPDWEVALAVGWRLSSLPAARLVDWVRQLSEQSMADQVILGGAIDACFDYLLHHGGHDALRKILRAGEPARGRMQSMSLLAHAAEACLRAARALDPSTAAAAVNAWFDFRARLRGGLPEPARVALAGVALEMDMILLEKGCHECSLLGEACLAGGPMLLAALCGMQRWHRARSEAAYGDHALDAAPDPKAERTFLEAVGRALGHMVRVIAPAARWPKRIRALIGLRHINKLALLSTFLVSPATSYKLMGKLLGLVKRAWEPIQKAHDSWYFLSFSPILWLIAWFVAVFSIRKAVRSLPRHNPWHMEGQIPAFFKIKRADREAVLRPIVELWKQPPRADDLAELVARTRAAMLAPELPPLALTTGMIESLWTTRANCIDLAAAASELRRLSEEIPPERRVYQQSCFYIVHVLLCLRRSERLDEAYRRAFADLRAMLDRWLELDPPGDYKTSAGHMQLLHLYRFARVASWTPRRSAAEPYRDPELKPPDAMDVFRAHAPRLWVAPSGNRTESPKTLLEEILYIGYEFNLWDEVAVLLVSWYEQLKKEHRPIDGAYPEPARELRAFLYRQLCLLRLQRPDRFPAVYQRLRGRFGDEVRDLSAEGESKEDKRRVPSAARPERGLTCPLEDAIFYSLSNNDVFRQRAREAYTAALSAESQIDWFRSTVIIAAKTMFEPGPASETHPS